MSSYGQIEIVAAVVGIDEPLASHSIAMCSFPVEPERHRICPPIDSLFIEHIAGPERFSHKYQAIWAPQLKLKILRDKARLNKVGVQETSKGRILERPLVDPAASPVRHLQRLDHICDCEGV